jgi:hypothetical protein
MGTTQPFQMISYRGISKVLGLLERRRLPWLHFTKQWWLGCEDKKWHDEIKQVLQTRNKKYVSILI